MKGNALLGLFSWVAGCLGVRADMHIQSARRSVRPRLTASGENKRDQKRRRRKQAKASRRKNR